MPRWAGPRHAGAGVPPPRHAPSPCAIPPPVAPPSSGMCPRPQSADSAVTGHPLKEVNNTLSSARGWMGGLWGSGQWRWVGQWGVVI